MLPDCDQVLLHLTEQVTAICPKALQAQGLTTREAEVLAWVARGKTNFEVATILSVRLRTVKKHMERIFQKLGVESRTAAAVARSTSHLLRALEEFSALGIDFVSLRESIDTSTPTGKMIFTILASVAELERCTIRERVIAGQRAAKRRGVRFGRPSVEVDTVRALTLRKQGRSWRDISAELGVPKDTVIRHCEAQ